MPKVRRQRRAAGRRKSDKVCSAEEGITSSEGSANDASECVSVVRGGTTAARLVASVRESLQAAAARPECKKHAVWVEKYMRNQFKFFGVKSPLLRSILADFTELHAGTLAGNRPLLFSLASALWQESEREFQYFGQELLKHYSREALGSSDKDFSEAMACAEQLIVQKSWWDTVDALSGCKLYIFVEEHVYTPPSNVFWCSFACSCGLLCQ